MQFLPMKSFVLISIALVASCTATIAQIESTATAVGPDQVVLAYDVVSNHMMMKGRNITGVAPLNQPEVSLVVNNNETDHTISVEAPTQKGTKAHFTIENEAGNRVYSAQVTPNVNASAVLVLDAEKHCLSRGTYRVTVETSKGRGTTPLTVTE